MSTRLDFWYNFFYLPGKKTGKNICYPHFATKQEQISAFHFISHKIIRLDHRISAGFLIVFENRIITVKHGFHRREKMDSFFYCAIKIRTFYLFPCNYSGCYFIKYFFPCPGSVPDDLSDIAVPSNENSPFFQKQCSDLPFSLFSSAIFLWIFVSANFYLTQTTDKI